MMLRKLLRKGVFDVIKYSKLTASPFIFNNTIVYKTILLSTFVPNRENQ